MRFTSEQGTAYLRAGRKTCSAGPQRWYLVKQAATVPKLKQELGAERVVYVVTTSGGKVVVTNQPTEKEEPTAN
jgi:hypothetical protein